MDLNIKRKERKALNSSLYSLTHRNARTIKLVSLRVRHIGTRFFYPSRSGGISSAVRLYIIAVGVYHHRRCICFALMICKAFALMIYNAAH